MPKIKLKRGDYVTAIVDIDCEGCAIVKGHNYKVRWTEQRGRKLLVMVDTPDGGVGGMYLRKECRKCQG